LSAPGEPADSDSLFDAAPCGLLRTSANGTILLVNRQFCEWLGFAREQLVNQRRLQDLLTIGGKMFHQTHLFPLLQMQGSVSEIKLDFVRADGSHVPMVLNAARRVSEGVVLHDVASYVARDRDTYEKELISSRTRLEVSVATANRLEAEARDHAQAAEQMIGIVSHDLRNPLASIAMGLTLLAGQDLDDKHQRTLQRVARAAERANGLIADLLDFTQARLGRGLSVALEPCDLRQLIGQAVDELTGVYPDRQLVHEHRGEQDCLADANRLTQLLGNLVSNAVAYGLAEQPVSVRSRIEAGQCSVAVHNQGAPISSELASKIFEPMSRGTDSPNTGRSVGLGLFIVREIAAAHHGKISVVSNEAGTTFTAEFPQR